MVNIKMSLMPLFALALYGCTINDSDGISSNINPIICPGYNILREPISPPAEASAPLSSISKETIDGNNRFAIDFYLANSKHEELNVCVSPFSVSNVLGMIANGDNGDSRDEILSLLGMKSGEASLNELNHYHQTLLSNLPNLDESMCVFTNSLWCDPQIPLYEDFKQKISKYFYGVNLGISPLGEIGMEAINLFVKTNTYSLIDNFLDSPIESSVAFLNTAYFKGSWQIPFHEKLTKKREFFNIDYSSSKVEFMCGRMICDYAKAEDGTEAVRLPYADDGKNFSMTLILPSSLINHIPLDEALRENNLEELDAKFQQKILDVILPKFEAFTKNDRTMSILSNMGLEKTCNPEAGFPLIVDYPKPFYLNAFIHASKIMINEAGTQGAAASMGGNLTSPGGTETNEVSQIVFDRPFIFMIRENSTGAILFIGSVKKLA